MRNATRRWVALGVVVLLGASACSGGDDADSSGTDSSEVARGDDPRTDAELEADQALADAAVLLLSDLPSGWAGQVPSEEDEDEDDSAKFAECLDVDVSAFEDGLVSATSDDFSTEVAEVSSDITIEPTVDAAIASFSIVERPEMLECFRQIMAAEMQATFEDPEPGDEMPEGMELGEVIVEGLPFPAMGDDTVTMRVAVPIEGELEFVTTLDLIYVRVGRALVTVYFTGFVQPFPTNLAVDLVSTLVERAET